MTSYSNTAMFQLNREAQYQEVPTYYNHFNDENFIRSQEYYSNDYLERLIKILFRPRSRNILILTFVLLALLFSVIRFWDNSTIDTAEQRLMPLENTPLSRFHSIGVPLPIMEQSLSPYLLSINPNEEYPTSVDQIKPHHIRVIGAMGDSLTYGYLSTDENDTAPNNPGNTFFTGHNMEINQQLSIYNIFDYISKKTNNTLYGASFGGKYGNDLGFNVAVNGQKSFDLAVQAQNLVNRVKEHPDINIETDWKLFSIWIGTNDVGTLGYRSEEPISATIYKESIEKCLEIIKNELPRSIVSIVGMFQPQLLQEAKSILETGGRARDQKTQTALDDLSSAYRNALFEIENEAKFDSNDFAVVVQPFATDIKSVFINQYGEMDDSFYAHDLFHLSKLGQSIIAKHLWQNLFEPVGRKTTQAPLADVSHEIFALNKDNSFIKVRGNS